MDRRDRGPPRLVRLPALQAPPSDPGLLIEGAVLSLAARAFRVSAESLDLATTPASCGGWDSQAHIELIMALEDHFSIRIGAADMMAIDSLRAVVTVVRARVG